MYEIFVFILIFVLFCLYKTNCIENFAYQTFQSFIPYNTYKLPYYPLVNPIYSSYWFGNYIPNSNGYTDLPWNNTSLGNTTNMSYDLRGDPMAIPRTNFVWNNGVNFPIYNEPI